MKLFIYQCVHIFRVTEYYIHTHLQSSDKVLSCDHGKGGSVRDRARVRFPVPEESKLKFSIVSYGVRSQCETCLFSVYILEYESLH